MSRQNLIESELKQLDGGAFQKLAEAYVYRKLGLKSLTSLGSQPGTNKPTKGIPDAHSFDGSNIILIAFTTAQCDSYRKLKKDIEDCLSVIAPSGHDKRVVCCHLVWRIAPEEEHELKGLHSRIELLGPKTIACDLATTYRDLAIDYLNIPLGSGALLTPIEWVGAENRRAYVTPQSGELRYRDKEISDLLGILDGAQIAVLHGRSGTGKTRLAIELINRYADKNRVEAFVLSGLDSTATKEDISAYLTQGAAIILIDDARPSSALDALLNVLLRNEELRLVLTVRDYGLEALLKRVRLSVRYINYPVNPLDDNAIRAVLREEHSVREPLLLSRIERVAHGNLRLAIMAARSIKDSRFEHGNSAYEIMDLFYRGLTDGLEEADLTLLLYLGIYSPCELKEGDPVYDGLLLEGLSVREMRKRARRLHDREILDLLSSPDGVDAIKFEQMNLQDYCIYRAFFIDHVANLREYICNFAILAGQRVIKVLNILGTVFPDETTLLQVREDCKRAWRTFDGKDALKRSALMTVIYPFIPDEACQYAKNEINQMPSNPVTLSERGDYNRQPIGNVPLCLSILCGLRDEERYPDAILAVIESVKKGCFELEGYKSVIEGSLGISALSVMNGFRYERKFISELTKRIVWERDARSLQFFGMKLCEQYLSFVHTSMELIEGGAIQFSQIEMPKTGAALALRAEAIVFLGGLLESTDYRIDAARALLPHVGVHSREAVEEGARIYLESAVQAFGGSISSEYRPVSFEEKVLLYHCALVCEAFSLPEMDAIAALLPQDFFDFLDLAEPFNLDEDEVLRAVGGWDVSRYEDVLRVAREVLESCESGAYMAYSLIDRVLTALASTDELAFGLKQGFDMFCSTFVGLEGVTIAPLLLDKIANITGWRHVIDLAIAHGLLGLAIDGMSRSSWASLTEGDLGLCVGTAVSGQLLMDIDRVYEIEVNYPGFGWRYCVAAKERLLLHPGDAHMFFLPLIHMDNPDAALDACFEDELGGLFDIYTASIQNRSFDYQGMIFRFLSERGMEPIDWLLEQVKKTEDYSERRNLICRLAHTSILNDSAEKMREVLDRLATQNAMILIDAQSLLVHNSYLARHFDVLGFIVESLRKGLETGRLPTYFTNVLMNIPLESRKRAYIDLLSQDAKGEFFEILPFGSSTYCGSFEEGYSIAYCKEIEIIKEISQALPKAPPFDVHRQRLSELIQSKEDEIERERRRGFLGKF